jgi:hypothetical protein
MNKLAVIILATASALAPAASLAQTGGASAPIAQPSPPARPTPPAGITWRNQAAPAPNMAPTGRAAPPPPIVTQRVAPPPPPRMPRAGQLPPPPRNFVIRRHPGANGAGPAEFEIQREMDEHDGPTRVIVRRHGDGHMADGPARVIVRRRHVDEMEGHHGDWDQEDFEGPAYEDDREYDDYGSYEEEHYRGRGDDYPAGHPGYGHGYASGGMITETITTTTTYPPTVEERVVHHETRSHPPRRTHKRKLRGR